MSRKTKPEISSSLVERESLTCFVVCVPRRRLTHRQIELLIDGAYLAVVTVPAGGPRSVLGFLIYVHLIAVTLQGTWLTGLKLSASDS